MAENNQDRAAAASQLNDDYIYFASESVGEGHPDKLCDQISDGILDACLKVDPEAKVAMETAVKTGMVSVHPLVSLRFTSISLARGKALKEQIR